MNISLSLCVPENLVSRDRFSRPVPRQPAHLHTQAESGAYLWDSSRVPRWRSLIYFKPPYAIGSVPSLSGHAIAYRWRSLPRVRRHRTSKPQGSFERVLPWQVTMDQLICASLSHTHYWYEVGMLKVPLSDRKCFVASTSGSTQYGITYMQVAWFGFLLVKYTISQTLGQFFAYKADKCVVLQCIWWYFLRALTRY